VATERNEEELYMRKQRPEMVSSPTPSTHTTSAIYFDEGVLARRDDPPPGDDDEGYESREVIESLWDEVFQEDNELYFEGPSSAPGLWYNKRLDAQKLPHFVVGGEKIAQKRVKHEIKIYRQSFEVDPPTMSSKPTDSRATTSNGGKQGEVQFPSIGSQHKLDSSNVIEFERSSNVSKRQSLIGEVMTETPNKTKDPFRKDNKLIYSNSKTPIIRKSMSEAQLKLHRSQPLATLRLRDVTDALMKKEH
jgi:hypothetical protein